MDCGLPQLLHQCDEFLLFDCTSLDTGYHSGCSSLSPASSSDSDCLSPLGLPWGAGQDMDYPAIRHHALQEGKPPLTVKGSKRARSKYPGKKRQSASEREKLRMRDLTKALHHLRTYLPPWVAPAGQTLTKIETLRLTIRYISYLSEQLGLGEDVLSLRTPTSFSMSLMVSPGNMQNLYQASHHTVADQEATCLSVCQHPPTENFPTHSASYQNPSATFCPALSQDCCFLEAPNISYEHF